MLTVCKLSCVASSTQRLWDGGTDYMYMGHYKTEMIIFLLPDIHILKSLFDSRWNQLSRQLVMPCINPLDLVLYSITFPGSLISVSRMHMKDGICHFLVPSWFHLSPLKYSLKGAPAEIILLYSLYKVTVILLSYSSPWPWSGQEMGYDSSPPPGRTEPAELLLSQLCASLATSSRKKKAPLIFRGGKLTPVVMAGQDNCRSIDWVMFNMDASIQCLTTKELCFGWL